MEEMTIKRFDAPDEERKFRSHGALDVLKFGGLSVGKGRFEPGWRWSNDVKPMAKTESCRAEHFGYCLRGRMRIRMDDGSEQEIGPGDTFHIPPGHDAWVVGNEPCVMLDFQGFSHYAEEREEAASGRRAGYEQLPTVH